ncbi:MAG: hypothetical protein UR66_C0003G0061 [Candidatus Moranbacteria bacterium GW2011_GWE1_35_17]|nr:MAG: hypothetical protein UR65_C0083G0002 [Candidatus Moranbacteria bacterium GW2011_GWE2_35_164]KKP68796.1 MAG: hypothetical protein UR66_C0003G0061 [Candidatus Moranbacteria bacterium GW2011_GWE1_35_17]KKP81677.1 MAG: hypothetical protein UR82_C0054G0007 [Candidatus Moranbacteria bacterium GW2011_GWF1_35_5]KKP82047.1 MAG: hypothetical protein UR83_C0059G0018 [Candidatus Moranbacteria bacterium GW2011_GWF2_35_54]
METGNIEQKLISIMWLLFVLFVIIVAVTILRKITPSKKEPELLEAPRTGKQLFILHGIPMIIYMTFAAMIMILKVSSGIAIFFGGLFYLIIPLSIILPSFSKGNKWADGTRIFFSSLILYPFSFVVVALLVVGIGNFVIKLLDFLR